MNQSSSNRRIFLKSAGAAFAAPALASRNESHPLPPALERPFPSLRAAFDGTKSRHFGVKVEAAKGDFGNGSAGVRDKRMARDAATHYIPGGVSGEEEPHSYFLTFEITNNRILCPAGETGLLENACIFTRMVPSKRRGRVFQAEELLSASSWAFGICTDGETPIRLPMTHGVEVELLQCVHPLFSYRYDALRVRLLVFAPEGYGEPPRALIAVVHVVNTGSSRWAGKLLAPNLRDVSAATLSNAVATPAASPHPRFTEHPVPVRPAYEAIVCLDEARWNPACPEISLDLGPGAEQLLSFGLLVAAGSVELGATARALRGHSTLDWFNATCAANEQRYGQLSIPGNTFYAESPVRLAEECRSAILYSATGACFNGGPSGGSDFAMTMFHPATVEASLRKYASYKARAAGTPAPAGLTYSLAGTVFALALVGPYYQMTGDRKLFPESPGILEYARELFGDLMAARKGAPYLFPSGRLWDGPALGDYHTGSNILAWSAFSGMARVARDAYQRADLAQEWSATAQRIQADIRRYCSGPSELGPRFYEGGNADGTFAPGHDGEEVFTTVAPFLGFCEADDPALVNHAKLSLTTDNPLYEPAVDGIWWDKRGSWGNGVTSPGHIVGLLAISDEKELLARLEHIRSITDIDGSIWWWPYLYPCNDPRDIRRRDWPSDTSKSGYTAATYLCVFINNILGIRVDVPARRMSLRPFCPWPEFSWTGARLGAARLDCEYSMRAGKAHGRLVNRNPAPHDLSIELTLPPAAAVDPGRVRSASNAAIAIGTRYGRKTVIASARADPDAALALDFDY